MHCAVNFQCIPHRLINCSIINVLIRHRRSVLHVIEVSILFLRFLKNKIIFNRNTLLLHPSTQMFLPCHQNAIEVIESIRWEKSNGKRIFDLWHWKEIFLIDWFNCLARAYMSLFNRYDQNEAQSFLRNQCFPATPQRRFEDLFDQIQQQFQQMNTLCNSEESLRHKESMRSQSKTIGHESVSIDLHDLFIDWLSLVEG